MALTGLLALAVAMGIGRFAFTPILPMMQVDAGLSLAAEPVQEDPSNRGQLRP